MVATKKPVVSMTSRLVPIVIGGLIFYWLSYTRWWVNLLDKTRQAKNNKSLVAILSFTCTYNMVQFDNDIETSFNVNVMISGHWCQRTSDEEA